MKISICIPLYNGEKYIQRCLDSIISQSVFNLNNVEIVVVDDSSSDNSLSVIKEYIQNNTIRLIKNEKQLGMTDNWNKALSSGTGDIVTLLHQDDWYDHNALTSVIDIFEESNDIAFVAFGQVFHPQDGKIQRPYPRQHLGTFSGYDYFLENMDFGDIPAPSTAFFKREHLEKLDVCFDHRFRFCSEMDLYIRLALANPANLFLHDSHLLLHRGLSKDRFSVLHPGYRILDFCRILRQYIKLLTNEKSLFDSLQTVRTLIQKDLIALIDLDNIAQFEEVIEDPAFLDWLKDENNMRSIINTLEEKGFPMGLKADSIREHTKQQKSPTVVSSPTGKYNQYNSREEEFLLQPVIILGFHHSGTRLLAKLLHEIGVFQVVDRETYEWGYIQELNDAILPNWNDPHAVRRFDQYKSSMRVSVSEIARRLSENHYKFNQLWGHKDPRTCVTISAWLDTFPKARIVHIVRDPLDVLGTLPVEYDKFTPLNKLPQDALDFWGELWMANIERIHKLDQRAERYIEVRFEDLCCEPQKVLRRICDVLQIDTSNTVSTENIKHNKIGIHQSWINEGRLNTDSIERLSKQVNKYRILYGYDTLVNSTRIFEHTHRPVISTSISENTP